MSSGRAGESRWRLYQFNNKKGIKEFENWFNEGAKDKIKILQDCKHSLISEFLAYWEGERFSCRGAKYGIHSKYTTDYDCVMFEDKIEYLEKEVARLIKKVRKQHKTQK